jgi:hypothetical protein
MWREGQVPGAAALRLVPGVTLLRAGEQVFGAMLDGWADQQLARNLAAETIAGRAAAVRAFAAHVNARNLSEHGTACPFVAYHVASGAVPVNAVSRGQQYFLGRGFGAPPAGFEPALTAPEAVALSPELWGLSTGKGYQSPGIPRTCAAAVRK